MVARIGDVGKVIQLEKSLLPVSERYSRTFFDEMCSETVDSSLGEFLSACFAGMLISITRVFELLAAFEKFQNELVGLSTHYDDNSADRWTKYIVYKLQKCRKRYVLWLSVVKTRVLAGG